MIGDDMGNAVALGLATAWSLGVVMGASACCCQDAQSSDAGKDRPDGQPARPALAKITEHLWVYAGPINVGILCDGEKALLIDCGDGSVAGRLGELGVKSVDWLIFTHHHRDQACGAPAFAAAGAKIGVPGEVYAPIKDFPSERVFFERPVGYFDRRWVNWSYHPDYLMLTEPLKVDTAYTNGQTFTWGSASIRAISTPGHTNGSMSYEVTVDGKRVIFSGDCIYDEGRIWELYSMTKASSPFDGRFVFGGNHGFEYEGFMWGRKDLLESLARIKEAKPEMLVPSHGRIMNDPAKAIEALVARFEQCFEKYLATSCLREMFPDFADRVDYSRKDFLPLFRKVWKRDNGKMGLEGPISRDQPVPPCLLHFGPTSWLLKSKDGPAFVVDCGKGMEKDLRKMKEKGDIAGVEGLWISHFHDDHVDGIEEFRKLFPSCPILADGHVAEVITQTAAWPPLPCLMGKSVPVDRITKDGESWQWHEFKLTAYYFPSQTLYHAGLLAEANELRIFFAGDSFTSGGLEDYCPYNRNWLGQGFGYDRCLELVEKLKPTHLLWAHNARPFLFTPVDLGLMRADLAEREKMFGELLPWDHPNYGLDGWWVMCRPYEQHAKAGGEIAFDVVITNHSTVARSAACRAVPPRAWGGPPLPPASAAEDSRWVKAEIAPKTDGRVRVSVTVPKGTKPGRYPIPVDVRYGSRVLPQFAAMIAVVDPG